MVVTIDATNKRSIAAITIAAEAGQWLRCHAANGRKAYGIRSQRDPDHVYVVTQTTCSCPDARLHPGQACKHQLAVRLYVELSKAEQPHTQPARPQRRANPLVARVDGDEIVWERRRHLSVVPTSVQAAAQQRGDIFSHFEGE